MQSWGLLWYFVSALAATLRLRERAAFIETRWRTVRCCTVCTAGWDGTVEEFGCKFSSTSAILHDCIMKHELGIHAGLGVASCLADAGRRGNIVASSRSIVIFPCLSTCLRSTPAITMRITSAIRQKKIFFADFRGCWSSKRSKDGWGNRVLFRTLLRLSYDWFKSYHSEMSSSLRKTYVCFSSSLYFPTRGVVLE